MSTFTFLRRFIKSNLQYIQGIHFFCQDMCSLGIEPTTLALLTQCFTTEPQEHLQVYHFVYNVYTSINFQNFPGLEITLKICHVSRLSEIRKNLVLI